MTIQIDFTKYDELLEKSYVKKYGRVTQLVGLTIESEGPDVSVGRQCFIKANADSKPVKAEVVGFKNNKILLMPLGDMSGVGPGSVVEASDMPLSINISEDILGRVLDGLGEPMDGLGPLKNSKSYPVTNPPPDPLRRNMIRQSLPMGVKAIDGLLTIGRGQRVGIFAGSGVGKSTLMGMIARNTGADINIIALVGERGREVREFIENDLGEEGLKRSVVVVATSDRPALERLKAAQVATSIAEYFRAAGKDVLFLMDSLTRYAMAQREIGLATGEPPVSRGYTPSVYSVMPKLLERAGCSTAGSITALYTVLVDGDDLTEPVTDTARGILDGHIVLDRAIAARNQYPAIDVLASISRVMSTVAADEHKEAANKLKKTMAVYAANEDLINIGAYTKGSNPDVDYAIDIHDSILEFLSQDTYEKFEFDDIINKLIEIVS